MREDFEYWWEQEGQYSELCGKELCIIAWSNGEYKAQTKPLSDEEIEEVIRKHWNREYGNRNMLTLCRAIEAKVRGENA